jgi:hypothetical protein
LVVLLVGVSTCRKFAAWVFDRFSGRWAATA